MRLSTRVRYGARLLVDLGAHYGEGPILLKEIAKRQGLSKKYLEQILIPLKSAGLVRAVRGSKGGYSLVKEPGRLKMIEVYKALEETAPLTPCLEPDQACPHGLGTSCPTRTLWRRLHVSMETILEETTLSDLIRQWNAGRSTAQSSK
jgi:Rrf2 family protein